MEATNNLGHVWFADFGPREWKRIHSSKIHAFGNDKDDLNRILHKPYLNRSLNCGENPTQTTTYNCGLFK